MVGSWPPCSPPLYRYRPRSVRREPRFLVVPRGLDARQATAQARRRGRERPQQERDRALAAAPGYFWGDWRGGYVYAGAMRMCMVHHSIFALNSLAHWLGEAPFDDKHSPRDHLVTALVTFGEGYHNFHHQFPTDYRNAIRWYQYDPTKWFISLCAKVGLASHLKVGPQTARL